MQQNVRVLVERFLGWFTGCFRRQRVILVITDSEAYDIVPNDSPRSPWCGVGTVIGHGSSGLSRAGFWRRRVLQSGFEIPWTPLTNPYHTPISPYPSPPTPTIPLYHINLLYVYLYPSVIITSLFFYLVGTGHHQPHHLSYYTLLGTNHCEAQHYTMLMVDVPVRDVQRDVTSHHTWLITSLHT